MLSVLLDPTDDVNNQQLDSSGFTTDFVIDRINCGFRE